MGLVTVKGIGLVQKNLNKQVGKIKGATLEGMIHAAIHVRRQMEDSPPKIPIDTGNLRASWYVVTSKGTVPEPGGGFKGDTAGDDSTQHSSVIASEKGKISSPTKPSISMGFTANYAAAVHENTEASFKRPGAGAKFFEVALRNSASKMIKIIAKYAKIK